MKEDIMSNNSGKKDWPARTFRISPDLLKRLNVYFSGNGISKTFVVEKALEKYLDEVAPVGKKE